MAILKGLVMQVSLISGKKFQSLKTSNIKEDLEQQKRSCTEDVPIIMEKNLVILSSVQSVQSLSRV